MKKNKMITKLLKKIVILSVVLILITTMVYPVFAEDFIGYNLLYKRLNNRNPDYR